MPIYAYRCSACGHAEDVLQRISDAPLTVCPACGGQTYVKQVTAAGFHLKGSGWYVTDFRDQGSKSDKKGKTGSGTDATTSPAPATDAASAPSPTPAASGAAPATSSPGTSGA